MEGENNLNNQKEINDNLNQLQQKTDQGNNMGGKQMNEEDNRTLMGVLSYISVLVFIPLVVSRNDPFVKFHVKQGLILLIIWVIIAIFSRIAWALLPFMSILHLILVILAIIGIVNVLHKKQVPLPVIGQLANYLRF